MKIIEEIGLFFEWIVGSIYWLAYLACVFFILIPFWSLYDTYTSKGTIELVDMAIFWIEIPAIALIILINKFLKRRRSTEPIKIEPK